MPRDFDFPSLLEPETVTEQPENTLKDYTERTRIRRGRLDIPMLAMVLAILIIGVIMVLSASFARAYYETGNPVSVFRRHLLFVGGSLVIMYVASWMRPGFIRKYSKLLMLLAIALLAAVLVVGRRAGGATRWIGPEGRGGFQPSELAKLAVILYFPAIACRYKDKIRTIRYGILPFLIWLGAVAVLLILEPHYSATIIIAVLGATVMFTGGCSLKQLAVVGALGVAAIVVLLLVRGYTAERITAMQDPFSDTQNNGWQIVQSLYAVGSGGLLGMGLGQGMQKYLWLPMEHNDYIFAIICEELGFIGATLVLILFALLIARGYWLALHARDRYGSLTVIAITTHIALQVFLNVAVVLNVIPSTGISLPFISYGGTALWIQMAEMGIILSVSRDIEEK